MPAPTMRDWRGIKFRLQDCTLPELVDLAANAQHTYDQVARFIEAVDAELIRRLPPPLPAGPRSGEDGAGQDVAAPLRS